ncbi:MAG: carbohydrate-binding domain-containing protein, partial [Muribaculaceae bacterium]
TGGDMSYCTAVKSDINIVMTGGEVSITHTGTGGKGFSADVDVEVSGGTIEATMSGDGGTYTTTDNVTDTYCSHAITCDGNMRLLGGTITLNVSGDAAKGFNSDGTIVVGSKEVTDEATACEIVVTASSDDSKAISSDENLTVNAGTINITLPGNQSKGLKSKKDIYINGGDLTFNCSGNAVDTGGDMSFCTAIKSDGSIYVNDGVIDITHTGTGGKGFSADVDVEVSGGTIKATMSGDGGTYTTSSNTSDTYSSHAIKSDGNMRLLGGTYTLSASGKAGKCIKSDGTLTIGSDDGSGPVISATTSGAKIGSTSSSGRPGPGGWGDQGNSATSSAKAIKCQGAFVMNGGDVTVNTSTDGAEGIESKTSMDFNGGSVYIKAYDDAINSAGIIKFAGAKVYAWSTGNDAIDSNALTTGAITVSGGVVIAVTSAGSPEEGMDADNAALVISGGYLFTIGGAQGGGSGAPSVPTSSTATQPTALASSLSLTQNQYVSVLNASGDVLFSLLIPFSYSSSASLVSCPGFVSGGTYTIVKGTSAPTDYESLWNGFYVGGKVSSTTTAKTITFSSNYVKV